MYENHEAIQLLNTAIIKSKEKKIDNSYEERLKDVCQTPAVKSLSLAINNLSETCNISRDQASMQIIDTVRALDNIWNDYVMMEGIDKLKKILRQ